MEQVKTINKNLKWYALSVMSNQEKSVKKNILREVDRNGLGSVITSIEIPKWVTEIGEQAFENNQLTSVVIPEGITKIEWQTFANNKLTNIVIPETVTKIGRSAFKNNKLPNK